MNQFGGDWTETKIEMIVGYAKAYLTIMNKYPQFEVLYFDGFAGSGDISKDGKTDMEVIKGAAIRILEIDSAKSFDLYYFVEMDEKNAKGLRAAIENNYPSKKIHVVCEDCNDKLVSMSDSFVLRNSKRSVMYHFMMATNNASALKIANDIVKPKFKL